MNMSTQSSQQSQIQEVVTGVENITINDETIEDTIEDTIIEDIINDDTNKKLFTDVYTKELNENEFDSMASFDMMPFSFCGIQTGMFGSSLCNPFFKLKEIAINKNNSWEDRIQAVRYMQKIPHIHRDTNCIEVTKCIISDDQYPFTSRFHFFSNNDRYIKLNYEIVNACHQYVYENFENLSTKKIPLIYKIISAQHMLSQFPINKYDSTEIQEYILSLAEDKEIEVNYRAECADILSRVGYGEYRNKGKNIIDELGGKKKNKSIYHNLENVHEIISENIINSLRELMCTVNNPPDNPMEIYECILLHTKDGKHLSNKDNITKAFQRILIDTSRCEGLTMVDILLLVWGKIKSSNHKNEMEDRLMDELNEMYKTCSTGHLSRILNVLSGFCNLQPIKITYNEQLKGCVFGRYSKVLRSLGKHEQDIIFKEMSEIDKPTIKDVIISYSPKEELWNEFSTYMTKEEFESVYISAENNYFGI